MGIDETFDAAEKTMDAVKRAVEAQDWAALHHLNNEQAEHMKDVLALSEQVKVGKLQFTEAQKLRVSVMCAKGRLNAALILAAQRETQAELAAVEKLIADRKK